MELKNTTKKNFVQLFLHLHSLIDYEELEKNGDMPIYYSAMEWYNKNVTNANYVELTEEDTDCLFALRTGPKDLIELEFITEYSQGKLKQKMHKLVSRGLVISYLDSHKKITYYKIAPLGNIKLFKYLGL